MPVARSPADLMCLAVYTLAGGNVLAAANPKVHPRLQGLQLGAGLVNGARNFSRPSFRLGPFDTYAVHFERANGGGLAEVSFRPLPGASKNAAIATASSTKTTSPIDEPRILIERGPGREVTGCLSSASPPGAR